MAIALDEANRMGLALPGLALSRQLYEALRSQGHGRDGRQPRSLHAYHDHRRQGGAERAADQVRPVDYANLRTGPHQRHAQRRRKYHRRGIICTRSWMILAFRQMNPLCQM